MNYKILLGSQLTAREIQQLEDFDRRYFTLLRQVRTGKIWEEDIPYSKSFLKALYKLQREWGLQEARSRAMKGRQPEGLRRWHERQRILKANKNIRKATRAQKKMLALSAGLGEIGKQKTKSQK